MSYLVVKILKTQLEKVLSNPWNWGPALSKGFNLMTSRGLFQCKILYNSVVSSGIQDYAFRIIHFWWAKAGAVGKNEESEQKKWQRQGRGVANTAGSSTALLAAWLVAVWAVLAPRSGLSFPLTWGQSTEMPQALSISVIFVVSNQVLPAWELWFILSSVLIPVQKWTDVTHCPCQPCMAQWQGLYQSEQEEDML